MVPLAIVSALASAVSAVSGPERAPRRRGPCVLQYQRPAINYCHVRHHAGGDNCCRASHAAMCCSKGNSTRRQGQASLMSTFRVTGWTKLPVL